MTPRLTSRGRIVIPREVRKRCGFKPGRPAPHAWAVAPAAQAINAGDPSFTSPPDFDQRGPGFPRVVCGRIDIGAFEVLTQPATLSSPAYLAGTGFQFSVAGLILTLMGCTITLSLLKERFRGLERWLDDAPLIVVENGRQHKERMLKERVDEEDILRPRAKIRALKPWMTSNMPFWNATVILRLSRNKTRSRS